MVYQGNGATPLYIACQNGHVECVRVLLGAGAAVNHATVGCARSMARRGGVTLCGDAWEPALMHYGSCVRVDDVWVPASMHVQLVGFARMRCG